MRGPKRAEREFGLLVGGVLLALGAWWSFRGKYPAVRVGFLAAGSVLLLLGAAAPGLLAMPRRAWMALAELLSGLATNAILFFVFFFVVTPLGLVRRAVGKDPMRRDEPGWRPYEARRRDPKHYDKLY